jgi:hypothetical protein
MIAADVLKEPANLHEGMASFMASNTQQVIE